MSTEPPTETLGQEGDACSQCGAALATDQRYCLNCGAARAEPRLDFQSFLRPAATAGAAPAPAPASGGASMSAANPQWSPAFAILGIGLLGVMLLLGVLIGKDDDPATVAAAPAATTATAAPTTAPTTDTAAATPTDPAAPKGADVPGGAKVVRGGSGSTEGIPTADLESLEEATKGGNESQQEASKKLPDVVATNGPAVEQDPNGKPGGNDGSPSACIGC
jgi:hypothetical protein